MRDLLLRFNRSVLFIGHGRAAVPDLASVYHAQKLGVNVYHGNIITLLQYRHPPGIPKEREIFSFLGTVLHYSSQLGKFTMLIF